MHSLYDRAFLEPFHRLAEQLGRVTPVVMIVLVVLLVGAIVAWIARRVVYRLLVLIRFDRLVAHTGLARTLESTRIFRSPAEFGARVVAGMLWLLIALLALSAADTRMTQEMVTRFINYLPDLVTAAVVLLLGAVVSKFLARSTLLAAVNAQWAGARALAGGVRILVMSLAVVMALEQLRIGRTALLVSFAILFAGVVMAGAIAFGFGARDLAREWLRTKLKPRAPEEEEEVFRHL
jgi:Conserved TM helix